MHTISRLVLASLVAAVPAYAQAPQPEPQPPSDPSKMDAQTLLKTGVGLIEAGNYLGALAIFRDAYARFPSAKILLNIGTTLKLLGRTAEAANTYQRYLDSPDADPARRSQVLAELAALDKELGVVEIEVRPDDAELELGDEWLPAAQAKRWRTSPGELTIAARKPGYITATKTISIAAGETTSIVLELAEMPKPPATVDDNRVTVVEPEPPRSRLGALAMVHVSVLPKLGSAALVGATFDALPALAVDAAVLLGPGLVSDPMTVHPPPSFGGYVGAAYAFMTGALRPRAGAGVTVFASDGARFQLRGAGGVELVANRNLSLVVELGAELALNPEDDIRSLAFVPSLAVAGRL